MTTLREVLTDPAAAGVYRAPLRPPAAALRRRVEAAGLRCFTLDGGGVVDKAGFLRACAGALALPGYFGRNWDALEECLRDLSWAPAPGYVILYDRAAPFIRHAPADWAVALAVFASAAAHWRGEATSFAVLLRRAGDLGAAIPFLTV
ncbi:MAG TPA: barstar family protein [Thermomicrobiales bacterium]|nr:barstar family protein [Thermomicrobiales bacterium]